MDQGLELTNRQRQCLFLSACGLREQQIAKELGISPHTVRIHLKHSKAALGSSTKSHSIVLALMTHNLSLDEIKSSRHFAESKYSKSFDPKASE